MQTTFQNKINRIIRIVSACLIIQLLITCKLWVMSWRSIPAVPLFSFLPVNFGSAFELFLLILLFVLCGTLVVKPSTKQFWPGIPAIFLLFVLEDSSRLQPWVYLYSLMFLFLFFDKKKEGATLTAWKIILSSVYFWSGLQKLNPHFATEMFPWLGDFTGGSGYFEKHHWCAYSVAAAESLAAIGLWFAGTRKISCFVILCLHLFILISLGPLGHNWNYVIWPWNLAFAWIAYELFYREEMSNETVSLKKTYFALLIFVAGIFPVFNFFGKADHFLSAGYYSSVASMSVFYFPQAEKEKLPLSTNGHLYLDEKAQRGILMMDNWMIEELNVPLYPEDRTHIDLAKKICPCMENQNASGIKLLVKKRFSEEKKEIDIPCSVLMR